MIGAALRQATSSAISASATKKMGAKILKLRILYLNVYMIVYVYIYIYMHYVYIYYINIVSTWIQV